MRRRIVKLLLLAAFGVAASTSGAVVEPVIPKAWDDEALRTWALLLVGLGEPPTYVSSEYYYRMPERVIYRSYPVYALGKEPPGYMAWLAEREPEIAFDASRLKIEADWIRAGEIVFDSPEDPPFPARLVGTVADVHDPAYYAEVNPPVGADGVIPGLRYSVTKKGEVTLAVAACSVCHTRVLPDGRTIPGAQGNGQIGRRIAFNMRRVGREAWTPTASASDDSSVPWLEPDPAERLRSLSFDEQAALVLDARQPGVFPRVGASALYPAKTPDLIGVRERKYFDATGHLLHRSIGDLMRYAASVSALERTTSFGPHRIYGPPPDPPNRPRLGDAQLYALSLYIYSLRPPENPNRPSDLSRRGERVFEREGCASCHTPPLYTNNMLTPASGVTVPEADRKR